MAPDTLDSRTRTAMALRILRALGFGVAGLSLAACGGNVVVETSPGDRGASSTTTEPSAEPAVAPVACTAPAEGERVEVCATDTTYPTCAAATTIEMDLFAEHVFGRPRCVGTGTCCSLVEGQSCGPYAGPSGECCYQLVATFESCEGRPLLVDHEPRLAGTVARSDWNSDVALPITTNLTMDERAVLGAKFTEAARNEHASIASFARSTLELLALGAPAELVEASQRAALDEVRHARVAFALAGAYGGVPTGPSSLDLGGARILGRSPAEVAASVALEGCINETIAALLAAAERDRATDPAVREALDAIATDEGTHAELAWRSLAWMMSVGDATVAHAVRRVFAYVPAFQSEEAELGAARREALAAHGWLSAAERRGLAEDAMREVVVPCAKALLDRCEGAVAPAAMGVLASTTSA